MSYREKAQEIIKSLSLIQKAKLFSGKNYWYLHSIEEFNLPSIMMADGPHGLRKERGDGTTSILGNAFPATCFPPACLSGCSFDVDLLQQMGVALGNECRGEDVAVLLGPGINHKRSPLGGRNFEYFSEDPLLSGKLATAFVKGVQSVGVGVSLKHFACNNQENFRLINDSILDERTLREIYLKPFEIVVKEAKPWTIMASYNKVNGEYATENKHLLKDILRDEWLYDGVVVTDWGALNDPIKAIKNGCNLEMPGSIDGLSDIILKAIDDGSLKESELDEAIIPNVELVLKSVDKRKVDYNKNYVEDNLKLAKKIATESFVLLKNEDNILPIKNTDGQDKKIALIGELAQKSRYQGAGSSLINPTAIDSIYQALKNDNINFDFALGYKEEITSEVSEVSAEEEQEKLLIEAKNIVKEKDIVICVVGLPDKSETEGIDRTNLDLPKIQNRLVREISKINPNVIVVLQCGGVVLLPWLKYVKGLLLTYLGGCQVGIATKEVLFGEVNPSGKLSETWPLRLKDNPSFNYFATDKFKTLYKEGLYTGYRYYDKANIAVQFPFGYGLSYSQFVYTQATIVGNNSDYKKDDKITIKVKVKNSSDVKGKEVIQIYIGEVNSLVYKPVKELKAFKKVELNPDEEKEVKFVIECKDLCFYNEIIDKWDIEEGDYIIYVGSSSTDIKYEMKIHMKDAEKLLVPGSYDVPNVYYTLEGFHNIGDQEFSSLTKKTIPVYSTVHPFNMNTTIGELKSRFWGRIVYKIIMKIAKKVALKNDATDNMMAIMMNDLPLRAMSMGGNMITRKMIQGIIDISNGKLLRGLWKIIKK